jgi:hypothetical protein
MEVTFNMDFPQDKFSSIELTKNSKGYTWSIKLKFDDVNVTSQQTLERISLIDSELRQKYTTQDEEKYGVK